ncbi:MAG: ABC transporter permease [Bacillota bacterium]|nr:ABC transporter permease [Bacillota bacterium]
MRGRRGWPENEPELGPRPRLRLRPGAGSGARSPQPRPLLRIGLTSSAALGEASRIAVRNLASRKLSSLLLVLLIGFSVLSYLTTSLFAAETRAGLVDRVSLGMERSLLIRLSNWGYAQTRYLDDPRSVEVPRTETVFACLVSDEPDGELDRMRRHSPVEQVWLGRLVTLQLPWGTDDFLSVQEAAPVMAGAEFVLGKPAATLQEIAIPESIAGLTGLGVGSVVPYLATDVETAAHSEGTLTVSGIYRPGGLFFRGALGWLPPSYSLGYVTDTAAHHPRILDNFEPNCYLVELKPGASELGFIDWLKERWYQDSQGAWHLHPRYPAVSVWSDTVADEFLSESLATGTTELSGIIGLSLLFVGIGTLTLLLLTFMERRREVAILKAVGLTGGNIATIFAMEVAFVALLGMAVGLGGAVMVMRVWLGREISLVLALRAAAMTTVVLYLSSMLPVAMARSATVAELLSGQRVIAIFRSRVSGAGAGGGRRVQASARGTGA